MYHDTSFDDQFISQKKLGDWPIQFKCSGNIPKLETHTTKFIDCRGKKLMTVTREGDVVEVEEEGVTVNWQPYNARTYSSLSAEGGSAR